MAMLKVLNGKGKYHDLGAREDVAHYICNPLKVESGFMGGIGVTEDIVGSMDDIAVKFNKVKGVQLRHFVLSFLPDELDCPEDVFEVACEIASFISREYQVVFAVHEDTENLHVHFMFHAVSYRDGHRYLGTKREYYDLLNYVNEILKFYKLKLMTVSNRSDVDIQGDD